MLAPPGHEPISASSPGLALPPESRPSSPTSSVPYSGRTPTRAPGACLRTFVSAAWGSPADREARSGRHGAGLTCRLQLNALSGDQRHRKPSTGLGARSQRGKRLTGASQPFSGQPPAHRHPLQKLARSALRPTLRWIRCTNRTLRLRASTTWNSRAFRPRSVSAADSASALRAARCCDSSRWALQHASASSRMAYPAGARPMVVVVAALVDAHCRSETQDAIRSTRPQSHTTAAAQPPSSTPHRPHRFRCPSNRPSPHRRPARCCAVNCRPNTSATACGDHNDAEQRN